MSVAFAALRSGVVEGVVCVVLCEDDLRVLRLILVMMEEEILSV